MGFTVEGCKKICMQVRNSVGRGESVLERDWRGWVLSLVIGINARMRICLCITKIVDSVDESIILPLYNTLIWSNLECRSFLVTCQQNRCL